MINERSLKRVLDIYTPPYSERYRDIDKDIKKYPDYKHYQNILRKACQYLTKAKVLDLGCGTGRYFHCLRNTELLVGVDVSNAMLEKARNPVYKNEISAKRVELLHMPIESFNYELNYFDFIYSIGVIGEYLPLTQKLLEKIYVLLKNGGVFFFTVTDFFSKLPNHIEFREILDFVLNVLWKITPTSIQAKLIRFFHPSVFLTRSELHRILNSTKFSRHTYHRFKAKGVHWRGTHFDCVMVK